MIGDLSKHLLGETRDTLALETSDDVRRVAVALVGQGRYGIDIFTRDLEATVYDDAELLEALKSFVLERRRVMVRVLVQDPMPAVRAGHRLIPLAQQLSTFFEIRVPALQHRDFNQAFMVVDGTGFIHRQLADRYDGVASFGDRLEAEKLRRRFEEMWEPATTTPQLRRMHL